MERILGRTAIREALENAGVTNIDAGQNSSFVPAEGQFTNWEIVPANEKAKIPAYPVVTGTNGTRISLGTLKLLGINTKGVSLEKAQTFIEPNSSGKIVLKGVRPVNPSINGGKDATIDMLMDKRFKAEKVTVYTLPYLSEGYADVDKAKAALVAKDAFVVTLFDDFTEVKE